MSAYRLGFPGVIKDGVVYTAANLGSGWNGFDLRDAIEQALDRPCRVANDADIQGLGAIAGHGIELVITLGTGFGSVIFTEGRPIHLELGHHPFRRGKTYEDELGERALKKKGRKKWLKLLARRWMIWREPLTYDALYIGGGNSRLIDFKLPEHVEIISNLEGLLGGIKLWEIDGEPDQSKDKAKAAMVNKVKKARARRLLKRPKPMGLRGKKRIPSCPTDSVSRNSEVPDKRSADRPLHLDFAHLASHSAMAARTHQFNAIAFEENLSLRQLAPVFPHARP